MRESTETARCPNLRTATTVVRTEDCTQQYVCIRLEMGEYRLPFRAGFCVRNGVPGRGWRTYRGVDSSTATNGALVVQIVTVTVAAVIVRVRRQRNG